MSIEVLEEYPDKALIKAGFFRERAVMGTAMLNPDKPEQKGLSRRARRGRRVKSESFSLGCNPEFFSFFLRALRLAEKRLLLAAI
jgi:hypothetical protein